MKKFINGRIVEMSPEEIATIEAEARLAAIKQSRNPLTEVEVFAMLIPTQINTLSVDDNTALRMAAFYPEWATDTSYVIGFKVKRNGKLYRVVQAHTSLVGWEPENALNLWEEINEAHSGALEDPIPYSGNMALESGLYYIQDDVWYRCIRDTDNPVYHALADLVGIYVEQV